MIYPDLGVLPIVAAPDLEASEDIQLPMISPRVDTPNPSDTEIDLAWEINDEVF